MTLAAARKTRIIWARRKNGSNRYQPCNTEISPLPPPVLTKKEAELQTGDAVEYDEAQAAGETAAMNESDATGADSRLKLDSALQNLTFQGGSGSPAGHGHRRRAFFYLSPDRHRQPGLPPGICHRRFRVFKASGRNPFHRPAHVPFYQASA